MRPWLVSLVALLLSKEGRQRRWHAHGARHVGPMFELAHGPLLVQVARERNLVDLNWVFVQQFTREEEKKKATERPEIERIELAEFHVVSLTKLRTAYCGVSAAQRAQCIAECASNLDRWLGVRGQATRALLPLAAVAVARQHFRRTAAVVRFGRKTLRTEHRVGVRAQPDGQL
jgi:hypothetical protein